MPDLMLGFWAAMQLHSGDITYLTVQHLHIVAVSGILALVVALPLGVWMSRPSNQRYAMACMQLLNVGQAIPKLALLALAMSVFGVGGGAAIFGLWVATLLPVVVNTYEGLRAVPEHLLEAAEAMGMTPAQRLWKVEVPNALNVIFAGIRTALAINVGTAPLAFLVGGGGLGELIFTGIDLNDFSMMLAGAAATAFLAIAVDLGCGVIQYVAVSRGLRLAARE
ncbi:osmoprotectant transport system permease protein [Pseudomonas sp. W3I7]|jgi:osmoprotectant transport system permease protein|uniref:ABC transporter permease n=1 Tax=Pseudomonas sp. W3I7 TaxID=3042292 RepID=UPI0027920052|nr:ABC transporter permease [Pseudomonas sp. W3I7]MDQ0704734.1 osmoprotectant transport system permease protein [Pseudomonas sp. W3I7]